MATVDHDQRRVSIEWLMKFGTKWAVLAAMEVDCSKRGARIPPDVKDQLKLVRMKIISRRFSLCEVGYALGKVEGQLISAGSAFGEDYLRPWFDLLGQAMEGRIEPRRIPEIPVLESVANDCKFLVCHSGDATTLPEA